MVDKVQGGDHLLKPLKWYKSLRSAKGRHEAQAFIVEGRKAIEQIIKHNPKGLLELIVRNDKKEEYHHFPSAHIIGDRQFQAVATSKSPQGIIAVMALPQNYMDNVLPPKSGSRILMLESIQDPGNVGTLIRTAAALDFSGIILSPDCADPFSPKAIQSAAGATFSLWLRKHSEYPQMMKTLQKEGFSLIAADINGSEKLTDPGIRKQVLLLGNEGQGLSDTMLTMADEILTIPFNKNAVESLNVAIAGALCMYHLR